MTENDYLHAWAVYGIAAVGCLWVWFKLTGWMWRYLREPLRVLVAVLLFTPTIVDPVKDLYAPAVAISALDLVFKVGGNVWRAASDLSMYTLFAFVAYLVFVLVRWPFLKRARERREAAAAREAAAQTEQGSEVVDAEPAGRTDPRHAEAVAPAPSSRLRVEPKL